MSVIFFCVLYSFTDKIVPDGEDKEMNLQSLRVIPAFNHLIDASVLHNKHKILIRIRKNKQQVSKGQILSNRTHFSNASFVILRGSTLMLRHTVTRHTED